MALVDCKECGKHVSDIAAVCPSCGIAAPALSNSERASVNAEVKRALYGRLGGIAFLAGCIWLGILILSGAEKQAVVSAWGPAKYLIFGGLAAYVFAEVERNLALRRKNKT